MVRDIVNFIYGIFGLALGLGITALAGRAYIRQRNRLALLLCIGLAGFSFTPLATVLWAFRKLTGVNVPDLWLFADATLPIAVAFLLHAVFFMGGAPRLLRDRRWLSIGLYVIPLYTALLWVVEPLRHMSVGPVWLNNLLFAPDIVYSLVIMGAAVIMGVRLWLLIRHSCSLDVRIQAKWLLVGVSSAIAIWVASDVFFEFMRISVPAYLEIPLGTLPNVLIALTFTVAILRHRLVDIDLIVTRTIVYIVLAITAALTYGGIMGLVAVSSSDINPGQTLVYTALTVIVTLALTPAYRQLEKWAVASFYPKTFALPESLDEISRYALRSRASVSEVLGFFAEKAHASLDTQYIVIYYAAHGVAPLVPFTFEGDIPDSLAGWSIFPEDIPRDIWRSQKPLSVFQLQSTHPAQLWVQRLAEAQCEWIIPLFFEGRAVGLVCLGPVLKGRHIVSQDVEHLTAAAYHAVLILEAKRFKDLAMYDHLTGVLTRQAFEGLVREVAVTTQQPKGMFCLVMLDVDNLKPINDEFGHLTGDTILRGLGQLLKDGVRPSDLVGRYGGDEFVICLLNATAEDGRLVIDRLQQRIRGYRFMDPSGKRRLEVTVSAGLAAEPIPVSYIQPEELDDYMERCDRALYLAKSLGRNQLVVDPFTLPSGRSNN